MVGMYYVHLLANHPYFEVAFVAASSRSAGRRYHEVVKERWPFPTPPPDLMISKIEQVQAKLIFSAVGKEIAKEVEPLYAQAGASVISNSSAFRSAPDIPVIIPEVNPDHLEVIFSQQRLRGWRGCIISKPNCSLQSYLIPLTALHREFGVKRLFVSTMQAMSGAGYAGLSSVEMVDNVIPFIAGEEEKSEQEPLKVWGQVGKEGVISADRPLISAQCHRVPVLDGHLASVSVQFEDKPTLEEIKAAWKVFSPLEKMGLPFAPNPLIQYSDLPNRPQPRLDRNFGRGMGITIGRLRPCTLFDVRFTALSHNTIRGAAGGGILTAELLLKKGLLGK